MPVSLAEQIRRRMSERRLTQRALAQSLDRPAPRISELLRGLERSEVRQDRLRLLSDLADALGLELVLAPVEKMEQVRKLLGETGDKIMTPHHPPSVFDELFIDLSDDDERE